jgi:hypothetical protein
MCEYPWFPVGLFNNALSAAMTMLLLTGKNLELGWTLKEEGERKKERKQIICGPTSQRQCNVHSLCIMNFLICAYSSFKDTFSSSDYIQCNDCMISE